HRGLHRRHHGRPLAPPRPAPGHGLRQRQPEHQGPRADVRDARVRPPPARHDPGTLELPHGVLALRGSAPARAGQVDRRGREAQAGGAGMIQASQLRPGMCILFQGDVCRIMNASHVTPGNLRGFVQARMRNLRNGNIFYNDSSSTEKVERAILDTQQMEYLYSDSSGHHFMNQETYEQTALDDEILGDSMLYLLPNTVLQIDFHDDKPVGIELPNTVTLEVVDT